MESAGTDYELEDEIKELSTASECDMDGQLEWKREQQSIVELCKVVKMKKRPFRTEDYSLKLYPVWYHERGRVIEDPQQLAIHNVSGNIFVADNVAGKVQVFDTAGHYLYHIPTPTRPIGLCLSDESHVCNNK